MLERTTRSGNAAKVRDMESRTINVFFYGLFMDAEALRAKGLHPTNSRQVCVLGMALQIGKRATLEQSPIRLTISRICQVCGAFSFGDLIETRGDGLAEASDGECAVLERI